MSKPILCRMGLHKELSGKRFTNDNVQFRVRFGLVGIPCCKCGRMIGPSKKIQRERFAIEHATDGYVYEAQK